MGVRSRAVVAVLGAAVIGCGSELPENTASFTVGKTVVRTDSTLDIVGVVFKLADTAQVPPQGPFRHWLQALTTELGDSAFRLARALGPMPVGMVIESYAHPDLPDSACGVLAGERRCLTGNASFKSAMRDFIDAARAFAPRAAPVILEGLNAQSRRQDLSDVYVALTRSRALDSAVIAYTGYADLTFDVTLARTFAVGFNSPSVDAAEPRGPDWRIFLAPDPVFPARSFRSPNYVWLALAHQMAHVSIRRLLAEHPEMLEESAGLREAVEGEMVRSGYASLFWDEALGEQLARAVTLRVLATTSPTATWAARSEALNTNMALVPWLEDALSRYERDRTRYPTLSAFAREIRATLDSVPLDSCRAAPLPGVALVGVSRNRAVVGWIAPDSPFRIKGLVVGDTVVSVDGDSVSAGSLLLPTRQLNLKWAQHLPFELAVLGVRRHGRDYTISVPVNWTPRAVVRVASRSRGAVRGADRQLPVCRWVTRAIRPGHPYR